LCNHWWSLILPDELHEYYQRRAREYERIYERDDPVRQAELSAVREQLQTALAGRRVLEIACGTGYWTQAYARLAERVVACDTADEPLAIAREKQLPANKVEFRVADAYAIDARPAEFDAGAAMFWLSHVPKARLGAFLMQFHAALGAGAIVVMCDNVYNPGVGGDLVAPPDSADTFKRRTLDSGEQFEVLKNYYTHEQLRELLQPVTDQLSIHFGRCYWRLTYRVRAV
jgi:SAM-dependent methyltransferase